MRDMVLADRGTRLFTNDQVREIRSLFGSMRTKDIARKYGVTDSAICAIKSRRNYRHIQ